MKVTLNWLRQYVDFDWSADELAERLTMLGLEVEGTHKVAADFEGIVVAQVITRDKHPNADKLSLCRVSDGQGERQIVCGADNFQAGDKVALILPGASLPAEPGDRPFTIKVGKIRGVESHGMMCSPKELGLADEADGLLILRPDAAVGQSFAEYLGRSAGDVVLDLEITPNRPDLNSVIGIAREIAAVTGTPLRHPEVDAHPARSESATSPIEQVAAVRLDAPDLCPRYTARVIQGVRVGPSPDWLRDRLESVGVRSINNVVDITNYVLMETGQPLHAFDYHLVAKAADGRPTIVVRRARPGESFTTLDGQTHALKTDMLLIADEAKGIALAGVMGGENTEINDQTTDVLLESAWFLPANIRRTSKELGLRTDASYRFERGADIGITDSASLRAVHLLQELAGGKLVEGVVDAYPQPFTARQVTLRHTKVNQLLGIELRPEEMEVHLLRLGLKVTGRKPRPVDAPPAKPEPATFSIPTWRPDLKREADLIEEIARLHGVDKIPSTPPRGAIGSNAFDAVHDQLAEARNLLVGLGLLEAQGQTLVSASAAHWITDNPVLLDNPLSSDMNVLRPSLLPGLLDSLRHNINRQNPDIALFEIGRVFRPDQKGIREDRHVGLALTGQRAPSFWEGNDCESPFDTHDLKGLVETFLEHFGLRGLVFVRRNQPTTLLVESAVITLGGKVELGELGQLQPALAHQLDLRHPVFLAELNFDQLLGRRVTARNFKALPAHPAVRRDVALLVPDSVTHEAVLATVRKAKPAHLENIELFDVFRGKNVPDQHKSVAYAFTYRSTERTLTDTEVNVAHEKLVEKLKHNLPATVRE
jgi:phenylalanyl-tRNA synthetase beta chain